MERAPTYCFFAGHIFFRGKSPAGAPRMTPISADMASSLREIFADESRAAFRAGDLTGSQDACGLWLELTRALDAHADWTLLSAAARRRSAAA